MWSQDVTTDRWIPELSQKKLTAERVVFWTPFHQCSTCFHTVEIKVYADRKARGVGSLVQHTYLA